MRAFSRQTIRVSNSSKFFFVKTSKDYRIASRIFPFLFISLCLSRDNKFPLPRVEKFNRLPKIYNARKAELRLGRLMRNDRELIASPLGRMTPCLPSGFCIQVKIRLVFCYRPFPTFESLLRKSWLRLLDSCFLFFSFFFVRTLQRKSRNSNENIVGFQRNHGILASNDFDGRNRSETMVRRYDKRSIVRNAIDPRQTVTVTRDALRNPTQFHVWLRTNIRVKINVDTRALHDPCRSSTERYPRSDYTYIHIFLSASHLLFSMIIFGNRIWTQNRNFNISHPDRGIL